MKHWVTSKQVKLPEETKLTLFPSLGRSSASTLLVRGLAICNHKQDLKVVKSWVRRPVRGRRPSAELWQPSSICYLPLTPLRAEFSAVQLAPHTQLTHTKERVENSKIGNWSMGQCFFFGFGVLKARTNFHFCLRSIFYQSMGQCFFFGFGVLKARTNFHFCLMGGNGFKKFARCLRENEAKKSKTAKIAEKLTSGWRKCVPQVIFPWFWGGSLYWKVVSPEAPFF